MIFENTLSLSWNSLPSQLIVSRLTLINSGVVKMSITTINVILPELKTEVLVINSFISILIEKSQSRGHGGGSLRLILRYDTCYAPSCIRRPCSLYYSSKQFINSWRSRGADKNGAERLPWSNLNKEMMLSCAALSSDNNARRHEYNQCSTIRILRFFRFQKTWLFTFFKWPVKKT